MVEVGATVAAGAVISLPATAAAALARSRRRRLVQIREMSALGSGCSCLSSRSASVMIPSTRRPASTTGTALIRCWASRAAISLNGVDGSAVTTSVVITSRTRLLVMGVLLARLRYRSRDSDGFHPSGGGDCLKYSFT
jgi:hypothetical protein